MLGARHRWGARRVRQAQFLRREEAGLRSVGGADRRHRRSAVARQSRGVDAEQADMTTEDAQKDALQRVVERIRRLAEQRAARLENREQKFASQSVESMLQDVDVLTQIFSNDKKLRMWVESVIRIDRDGTIRLLDGAKHRAEVSDFWH